MGAAIASAASVSKERRLYHIFKAFHYGAQGIMAVGCDKTGYKSYRYCIICRRAIMRRREITGLGIKWQIRCTKQALWLLLFETYLISPCEGYLRHGELH